MAKIKPSIIIVMKDTHLRAILRDRFEREGWKVEAVEEAADAERRAVRLRPMFLLIDWQEGAEGVKTAIRHWRGLTTLHKAKIIIVLHHVSKEQVDEVIEHGADQVILTGTLSPREIIRSVTRNLEPIISL